MTDVVVVDKLVVGSLMTSYADDGKVETTVGSCTKTSDAEASVRSNINGWLSGHNVNNGWCGESSHDGARETG